MLTYPQEQLIYAIEKRSGVKQEPGDYEKDGLIYCGKCYTPKQTILKIDGKILKPFCLCKCKSEERDKREAEEEMQRRMERVKGLKKLGFADAELTKWTIERDDGANKQLSTVIKNYVENFEEMKKRGKGLLLYGNVGSGKTFAAAAIANALIEKGYPCLVTNFSRLLNTVQGMFEGKQEYIDGLNRFELLVIDDLAAERDTEYVNETVYSIIDARYRYGAPLVVTTNLTPKEIQNQTDVRKQRIYSRLMEMCIPVPVVGVDRRRKKPDDDLKRMLGL